LAKVAILQPVIGVKEKMDRSTRPATWARLERMTLEAAAGPDKPDLIVWPESSRPDPVTWKGSGPFRDDRMEMLARKTGIPILYGSVIARVVDNRLKALYNGAALVFPDGRQAQWYGKQRLLPLAEMVPFRKLFGIDPYAKNKTKERKSILTMLGRFVEGPEPTLFEIDGLKFGVLICYEGSYPALSRAYRNRGATALMILTNDAWWGRSAFAPWHAKMVATRARELELPVIRAANSGVSSHTDVRGRQIAATGLDERTTVRVDVSPGPLPRTFFARRGHVIPFGFMLGCFMIFPLVRRFRKVG
jgi:apolipoprotein N-acyltransferase